MSSNLSEHDLKNQNAKLSRGKASNLPPEPSKINTRSAIIVAGIICVGILIWKKSRE
jgi:hypothetical protein